METEKNYHTTKEGEKILISSMTTEHLINTIRLIERKAKKGIEVYYGSLESTAEEIYCDCDYIFGEEALRLMNYYAYKEELKKRELKNLPMV